MNQLQRPSSTIARLLLRLVLWLSCLSTLLTPVGCRTSRVAPFRKVEWKDGAVRVQVEDRWHELVAIDGVPVSDLQELCRTTWGARWRSRFALNLAEVMKRIGHPIGSRVDLRVREGPGKPEQTLPDVALTSENWELLFQHEERPRRIEREHSSTPRPEFAALARRFTWSRGGGIPWTLTAEQAAEDLDQLEWHLVHEYSYLKRKDVDYVAALDTLRLGLGRGIDRSNFCFQIEKLIALFGDGHSGIYGTEWMPQGFLPFLTAEAGGRIVAFLPNRSGFLDPRRPYVKSLDGLDVERWIEAGSMLVSAASPRFVRHHAVRDLRNFALLREELGRPAAERVSIQLESEDRTSNTTLVMPLSLKRPKFGAWPLADSRVLEGNIGYLRIPEMEDDPTFLHDLRSTMEAFRETRGLVIDVRGNGGGSRDALQTLFPYFMRADDPPRVANVAAYRLTPIDEPGLPDGYLQNRDLHPLGSKVWSPKHREAVARFANQFAPEWKLPDGFSELHYFVLTPHPEVRRYGGPTVILMDSQCFSATDIFLAAFKGMDAVTLMGTPSGGGSGRAQPVFLEHSMIILRLSSMASFQPTGLLYDGRGVEPDVEAAPVATDHIGVTDTVLDKALERLRAP